MFCYIFNFRRKSGESKVEKKKNPGEPVVILEPVVIQDSPDPIIISDSPAAKPVAPSSKKRVVSSEAKLPSALTQQSANKKIENKLSDEAKLRNSSRTKLSSSSSGKSDALFSKRVYNAEKRSSLSKPEPDPGITASRCGSHNVFAKFKSGSVIGNKAQSSNGEVKQNPCSDNDKKSSSKRPLKVGNDNLCNNALSDSTERSDVNKDSDRSLDELNDLPAQSNVQSCSRDGSSAENAIDLSESNVYSECGGGGIGSPCEVDEKVSSQSSGIRAIVESLCYHSRPDLEDTSI